MRSPPPSRSSPPTRPRSSLARRSWPTAASSPTRGFPRSVHGQPPSGSTLPAVDTTAIGIGASPRRKEDRRLLVGGGRYLDDIARDGALHLGVVRSPHAHARIVKVDVRE